uniref:Uncharacterized protein n=1 Tax=Kwoniella pini CBS 10737 TaxID=1296096 RepID=A0A1B9HXF3_9TREE|nr:uncharacterized protein I206_05805 [Kwoniella pini CBS 10737]OCF47940.1 hypothetical protein I206_05805 [Kwoniella pini CBS 10737]
MSSVSGLPTPQASDTLDLLPQFLDILRSSSPNSIPPQTLLGAITHFLSQLEPPYLEEFTQALICSPSIWRNADINRSDLRNALRLSVSSKINKISQDTRNVYFADSRKRRKAREWLDCLNKVSSDSENTSRKLDLYLGLLQGVNDVEEIDWGKGKVKLEEEVVMALSQEPQNPVLDDNLAMCAALPLINIDRLRILDIQSIANNLESSMLRRFRPQENTASADLPDFARALGRSFEVLHSGGPSSQENARQRMMKFCERIEARGTEMERDWEFHSEKYAKFEIHSSNFAAFLAVASTMIDILLAGDVTSKVVDASSIEVAVHILAGLTSFAYLTDASDGGFEDYYKVFYGSLDIISAQEGNEAIRTLFSSIARGNRLNDGRAAYVLVLGDELMKHLAKKEIDMLLTLAERHIYRPKHKASFEASHAFLLSLIKSSADSLENDHSQAAFFDAILLNYLSILNKQYTHKEITSDQFRQAFLILVETSSKRSSASVQLCISYLLALPTDKEIRRIRVDITPYINSANLPQYLDNLAQAILSTEKYSEERTDLTKDAFEMVVKGLSDADKQVGIQWWTRWRAEFVGGRRSDPGLIRSRL